MQSLLRLKKQMRGEWQIEHEYNRISSGILKKETRYSDISGGFQQWDIC